MNIAHKLHSSKTPIIHGDLFHFIDEHIHGGNNGCSIIVPHVCNNINLFDCGFAAAVANRFPIVKENYHLLGNKILGHTQFVEVFKDKTFGHSLIFANMISQNGIISPKNPRPLNYASLCQSMMLISKFIREKFDKDSPVQIHAPKFGCGLAGGNWNFVTELIRDIWCNIPICVYEKK
jgi:hypothetical protein